jgi:hypothetical protein
MAAIPSLPLMTEKPLGGSLRRPAHPNSKLFLQQSLFFKKSKDA